MLVNGEWKDDWKPVEDKDGGRFVRQTSSFRHWITPDGSAGPTGDGGFKAEKDRYHLYVSLTCPWACRTLMACQLKQLTHLISITVVSPRMTGQGWRFGGYPGVGGDDLNGANYLHELYTRADPQFTGRATVPILWDKKTGTIVNNESADILRMLNTAFAALGAGGPDLYPSDLAADIDELNERIYTQLNNGVYQAGFATDQSAYEEAWYPVFEMLDALEKRLSDGRTHLFGDRLTETDVRLFVTLVRFDAAYHSLFKCNRNTLREMQALHNYLHRVLKVNGVADTVNIGHIKTGYYSIKAVNPSGVVPLGPREI